MALRSVWKSSYCECPAGHKTAGLWKGNRESQRGGGRGREESFCKDRGRKKEEGGGEKTWGFYVKEGICVKCILCNETPQFCSLKQRYLELGNKNLSPCPSPVEPAVPGLQWAYPPFHKNTPALYCVRFSHWAGRRLGGVVGVSFQSSC